MVSRLEKNGTQFAQLRQQSTVNFLFESHKLPSSVPYSGNHFLLSNVYQVTCDLLQFPYWEYRINFLTIKFCLLHKLDSDSDIIKAYVARNICIHDLICDDTSLFTTIHWSGILILTTAWVTGKTSKIWTYIWYTRLLKYAQVVLRWSINVLS